MKAWLLTWEGTTGAAKDPDRKIVSVISSRMGYRVVKEIVTQIYLRTHVSIREMARLGNNPRNRDSAYLHTEGGGDRLFYGHNPCIYARIVSDLRISYDDCEGVERITWVDPPYARPNEVGGMPVEIEPAKRRSLVRVAVPPSSP